MKQILTTILAVTLSSTALIGQSIYSAYGIGELRHFSNVRMAGMGGAGIAMADAIAQNHLNPAQMADVFNTSLSGGLRYEGLKMTSDTRSRTAQATTFNDFSLTIKTNNSIAIGIGLHPYSDTDYKVSSASTEYVDRRLTTGGLSMGYIGFAYRVNRRFAFGLNYNQMFGQESTLWERDFEDPFYVDTVNEQLRSNWGRGVTVGAVFDVIQRWKIGAVYSSEIEIKSKERIQHYAGKVETINNDNYIIPKSFGLGTAFALSRNVSVAADYYQWNFNDQPLFNSEDLSAYNANRASIGVEYTPNLRQGSGRIFLYRFGFYHGNLYGPDVDGSQLSENFLTAGYSLPFYGNFARLDFSFEGGVRSSASDILGSEKIFKFNIGLSGGERWFVRYNK